MKLISGLVFTFLQLSAAGGAAIQRGRGVEAGTRDYTTTAAGQCVVRVAEWDYDKDGRSGRARFDLAFAVETDPGRRPLLRQPRGPVADGEARAAAASGLLAPGFAVTPTGNRLAFGYRGRHWVADRAHCAIGQWSVANDVVPRRDVSCQFDC